jgi:hypothetical protein
MNRVRISRLSVEAGPGDATNAARIARRATELLGRQLALGDVVGSRRKLTVDIERQPGWSEEQLARKIALELASRLL